MFVQFGDVVDLGSRGVSVLESGVGAADLVDEVLLGDLDLEVDGVETAPERQDIAGPQRFGENADIGAIGDEVIENSDFGVL